MSQLKDIAAHFGAHILKKLNVPSPVKIVLSRNKKGFETYAYYNATADTLHVYVKNRGTADVLRSIAHEMVHHKQKLEKRLAKAESIPDVGGPIEDEANAIAGQLVKAYGKQNKEKYNIYS